LTTFSIGYRAVTAMLGHLAGAARHDITQGLVVTITLQVGGGVISFAMFSLAARVLSASEFGHLALWLSVCQMASVVALLGQEMFILRSLNEYSVSARPDLAKGSLLFSTGLVAVVPLLAGAAIALVGTTIPGQTNALSAATGLFLVLSSMLALSSHIARSTVGIFLADGMRELFWRALVVAALLLLTVFGLHIQIDQFFLIASLAIAIALLIQVTAIWRAFPKSIFPAKASWRLREWVRTSTGFWASTMLETVNQYFDVVIVYLFLDPVSAGAYFIATRLSNMFGTVLAAVHNFATRRIPSLYFAGRIDELNATLRRMAEVVLLCVIAGVAIIGFGAEPILALFGPNFIAQKWTLIILTAGTAMYAAGGPASAILMIAGFQARYPLIVAANIAIRFIGFAVLIPIWGLPGAALSATLSLGIVTVALNVLCRRWVGVDPSVLSLLARPEPAPVALDTKVP
jgi:O-antigen/teichoic acid export membrane protein